VVVDLANDLPKINTSPDMLTEAFKVLIKNANEAITENGSERRLSIKSHKLDSNTVEVVMRDNGIGIKREDLNKVFKMRWTTKSTGLGFGLFWTKDYIEGLGGSIALESIRGEGTTFTFLLPTQNNNQASK
jgi:signal transduction histidine kinase